MELIYNHTVYQNESYMVKIKLSNGLTGYFEASFFEQWTEFADGANVATSGYWWIGIGTGRKRKHILQNEDHLVTFKGGVNCIPFFIEQLQQLQEDIVERNDNLPIIIWWADPRRKHTYIRYLTKKMGFRLTHFTDVDRELSLKVLIWKPSYNTIEK